MVDEMTHSGYVERLSNIEHQWLRYVKETYDVFDRYPFAQPLLWLIFQQFYIKRDNGFTRPYLWTARVLARQFLGKTKVPGISPEVMLWVPRERDTFVKPLVSLYRAFTDLGLSCTFLGKGLALKNPNITDYPRVILAKRLHSTSREQWGSFVRELSHSQTQLHGCNLEDLGSLPENASGYEYEMRKVLSQLKPKAIVMTEELLPSSRTLCIVARNLGIKMFVLQHGAINAYYTPVSADYFISWGQTSTHQMSLLGVEKERILTLGSPAHDYFTSVERDSARTKLLKSLNLPDYPTFVFFSNGNDPVRNTMEALVGCKKWLSCAAKSLKGKYNVVVRLHPNEDGSLYQDVREDITIFKNECDVLSSIAGADVIGSLCSTVLSEAVLCDVPVIQFLANSWPELVDNWRWGLAQRVFDAHSLVETLLALSNGARNARKADASILFANPGHAAAAIADAVRVMC